MPTSPREHRIEQLLSDLLQLRFAARFGHADADGFLHRILERLTRRDERGDVESGDDAGLAATSEFNTRTEISPSVAPESIEISNG